jgi:hypothetical protein
MAEGRGVLVFRSRFLEAGSYTGILVDNLLSAEVCRTNNLFHINQVIYVVTNSRTKYIA